MSARSSGEWLRALEAADIPAAPIHTLDSFIEDPHLAIIGLIHAVVHPTDQIRSE